MFYQIFGLASGDVVCVTGAGGKTSLIKHLATEMAGAGTKALISTTTRLAAGEIDSGHDFLVEICGEKALAPKLSDLKNATKNYDITLIETDGSARKPLKGWAEHEPVIPDFATHTIGVLDISTVGTSPEIHRPELFEALTGGVKDITVEMLADVVNKPDGLFKNSGDKRKALFLAKAETDSDRMHARELAQMIKGDMIICMGSVQLDTIERIR